MAGIDPTPPAIAQLLPQPGNSCRLQPHPHTGVFAPLAQMHRGCPSRETKRACGAKAGAFGKWLIS